MARRNNIRRTKKSKEKKEKKKILFAILAVVLFLMFFSVIFSLLHLGNNKIIQGVKIGNIEVSNLTQEEAKEKVSSWYIENIITSKTVRYEEMEEKIEIEKINIPIDKLIKEAVSIGKTGNIIKDNYDILFCTLFGKKIEIEMTLEDEEIDNKINELNNKLPNALQKSNYYVEGNNLILTKGKSGITIKEEEFIKSLKDCIGNEEEGFVIPVEQEEPEPIDLQKIKEEICKEEKNASISQDPIKIEPEVNGVKFAISMEEIQEILKEDKEQYVIPLTITIPEITLEKLGKEAFPSKLGGFTTRYDASNQNRSTNLELASKKIDGTIILPGETFSYNKIVGERTISQGYKEAAVYSNGKVVDGIGGGICQISSTLYNAVIYANLEVTSRSNHRFLTSYVTAGRDATVSWGTVDFCFKNTRSYPIKIVSTVKNGVVTIEIYGMQEEKEYEVVIENTVTEVIPYEVTYVQDDSMQEGEEEIKQYGCNGAKSETYKILKYNGMVVSKTLLSKDTYSALERIIKTGQKQTKKTNGEIVDSEIVINKEEFKDLNPELLESIRELE